MQRKLFLWLIVFSIQIVVYAQDSASFSTYYFQRLTHFRTLPEISGSTIFLGNSITDGAEWNELFQDGRIRNRGISGDVTAGVLYRLNNVVSSRPAKIFLLIGVNDLARGRSADSVAMSIFEIAKRIRQESPQTKLFVQSLLPVNDELGKFPGHVNKGKEIVRINRLLKDSAGVFHYVFINIHDAFCNDQGKMDVSYTNDGLHLKGDGYLLWQHLIYPFVYDATTRPALIPQPQKVVWEKGFLPLYRYNSIGISDTSLRKMATAFQHDLKKKGWNLLISENRNDATILLRLGNVDAPKNSDEAYQLEVTDKRVVLSANTPHGIFNGLQTLTQLMRDNLTMPSCRITDWPAFAWRGYMIDVGRNFMSVKLLKQQIEVMSRYKLNVFHLHLTEDIAWRLAIKKYPQLTAPENMERDAGAFYSEDDLKDLIRYCKKRYITLVPEIDMPGHSAAFRRAMKTDMQSETGIAIIKNILKEIFDTYDIPYIHIGADEVKITNKNFLSEIINFIRPYHKKIIAWEPGGNYSDDVIRQLWMGGEKVSSENKSLKFIDSRHLYLNHMDPEEAVVTLFYRRIDDVESGDSNRIGATLCTWNDRRVEDEIDIFRMNPVYPGIVTFGERVWRGGGRQKWTATIGSPDSGKAKEFAEFETRLMDHKRQYFSQLIFPYRRQAGMVWNIYGPYNNRGNMLLKAGPELNNFDTAQLKPFARVTGGTIILRHWWYPMIDGVISNPVENSTVYAVSYLWSDRSGWRDFWIGFNNLSRSPATDSPPVGEWDNKNSEVWVNGHTISPPLWHRAGMVGNEEVPLTDEGYEYRPPTKIFLKKGWNTVWIKAPVGAFKGKNWQNPVKWMFTFLESDGQ